MKKLYRKSTVHPSPPLISDHLALLPAAIFTLTMALSPEDKEVLAYLVSSTNFHTPRKTTTTTTTTCKSSATTTADHPPLFNCSCFRCYTSYWVRWDSSPNRQLIHEIIDAFEDGLIRNKREKSKKDRKKKYNSSCSNEETSTPESTELPQSPEMSPVKLNELDSVPDCEEGSVRKLVNFLGERIWSVWT